MKSHKKTFRGGLAETGVTRRRRPVERRYREGTNDIGFQRQGKGETAQRSTTGDRRNNVTVRDREPSRERAASEGLDSGRVAAAKLVRAELCAPGGPNVDAPQEKKDKSQKMSAQELRVRVVILRGQPKVPQNAIFYYDFKGNRSEVREPRILSSQKKWRATKKKKTEKRRPAKGRDSGRVAAAMLGDVEICVSQEARMWTSLKGRRTQNCGHKSCDCAWEPPEPAKTCSKTSFLFGF